MKPSPGRARERASKFAWCTPDPADLEAAPLEDYPFQSGRAEMTFWNPPNWTDRGTVVLEPGMVFFLPRGGHVWFKVLSEEPFRRVVVDIPNPGFEFRDATQR